jgi:hypothetical protein
MMKKSLNDHAEPYRAVRLLFLTRRNGWLIALVLVGLSFAGLRASLGETRAAGVTWNVDNGSFSNDSNCTTALRQCNSIGAAVAAASPGDTITVSAGSSVYIGFSVTTPDLTILGPNASYNPVTGSRFPEAKLITEVTVAPGATGVTIQGFEFNRTDNSSPSIQVNASHATLKYNFFTAITSEAIVANGPISNLAIDSNAILQPYTSIEIDHASASYISGNKLGDSANSNNNIESGILLDAVDNILISENQLNNLNNQAIEVANTGGPSSNITISNNLISRANKNAVADQGAIRLYGDNLNSISPLTITNNIIQSSRNGVAVKNGGNIPGDVKVSNNCFNGTIFADLYHGGSGTLNATNNYSDYSIGSAPSTGGIGPVVVTPFLAGDAINPLNSLTIEGNLAGQNVTLAQVKNSDGLIVPGQIISYRFLTAAGSNPVEGLLTTDAGGNAVLALSQPVPAGSYDLVLNPTTSISGFPVTRQGCQAPLTVTLKVTPSCTVNDASGSAGYTNISAALAGPCSTIRVTGGGPYQESLVIDRPVVLKGPNAGKNPNTAVRDPEVNIYLTNGFNDPTDIINKGAIARITSSNVVIDGFTLDGNNPSTDGGVVINGEDVNAAYAITNYNLNGTPIGFNNVTVQNNIFKNFNIGALRWAGISSPVSDNLILNNLIDNIFPASEAGYGIYLGDNFYAEVAGNEMLRVRQGIQIKGFETANPGAAASLHDNTIDSFQSGIRYESASGFTISANTLKSTLAGNANIGLWLTDLPAASPAVTITNNLISGGDVGIKAWGVPAATITGGSIVDANYGVYLHNFQTGPSPNTPDLNAALTLDGITISNSGLAGVYLEDNTGNGSNDLALVLQGGSLIENGSTGIVVLGQDTILQLNDTVFRGQNGDYITFEATGGDGVPDKAVDARTAKFEDITGADLNSDQYNAVQNKLTDKNDNSVLGLVIVYNPVLAISSPTLTYNDILGGANPASQSIVISNPAQSSLPLDWVLETPDYGTGPSGWLSCGAPLNGTLASGENTGPISCLVTTGSLAGGAYSATFRVTSNTPGVSGNPGVVAVTFNVIAPPEITVQPASQTIVEGQPVTLNVTASSLVPLNYQWYEGIDEVSSTQVGLDSASFTSPALTNPTSYWVKVSNSAGSVNSDLAHIAICAPLVVTAATDSGTGAECGTLSYALKKARLSSQAVTVSFGSGLSTITLTGPLDPLTNLNNVAITLDGACNAQGEPATRLLAGANSGAIGLRVTNKVTVRCLAISGFSEFAVSMEGNENQLQSSWVGTLDGLTGSGSGGGIKIAGNNNLLGVSNLASSGNRIFGNNNFAVRIASGQENWAYYNSINLSKNGNLPLPERLSAVYIAAGGQLKFGLGNHIHS